MISWSSSVYEASWSEMIQLRKVSGKCMHDTVLKHAQFATGYLNPKTYNSIFVVELIEI